MEGIIFGWLGAKMEHWNKDNGKVVVGLTNRRLDEKRVFNTPVE